MTLPWRGRGGALAEVRRQRVSRGSEEYGGGRPSRGCAAGAGWKGERTPVPAGAGARQPRLPRRLRPEFGAAAVAAATAATATASAAAAPAGRAATRT